MPSIQLQNKLVILGIVFYLLAMPLIIFRLKPYSTYETYTQVTLLFSAYVVLFAVLEGFSTYMQVVQTERRTVIEDLWRSLELAYGQLYKIITYYQQLPPDFDPYMYWFSWKDKEEVDRIFSTLPFMLPKDLYDFWKQNIRNLEPEIINLGDSVEHRYIIPEEFTVRVIKEYEKRVTEYYSLVGK